MKRFSLFLLLISTPAGFAQDQKPALIEQPDAFKTLVNPMCSHCRDEAKRRASELRADDRVLCWTRGYSEGGVIPYRFFLNPYRVISDTYGVFVYDPDAGYARGFAPSLDFTFHGWKNGVMVMKHKDGTLYSCLTGIAFDGPRKGDKLKAVPTLVSNWGHWLDTYPQAVAYNMFEKYQPIELPTKAHPLSLKSRGSICECKTEETRVFGVAAGKEARSYSLDLIAKAGLVRDDIDGKPVVLLWLDQTKTAAAYRPIASPPKKSQATPRNLTIERDGRNERAPFRDKETGSHWDIAGRAVDGEFKGWTLEWLDGVEVKSFAWNAEYPHTATYAPQKKDDAKKIDGKDALKEIAGSAEFLRAVPKRYGRLHRVDDAKRSVTILFDKDKEPTNWTLTADAEIKIYGWWGRLKDFEKSREPRVWAWFKVDRAKKPVAIFMLADEPSEQDIHGDGLEVQSVSKTTVVLKQGKGTHEVTIENAVYWSETPDIQSLKAKDRVYMQQGPLENGKIMTTLYDRFAFEKRRGQQKASLRKVWLSEGLPGAIGFLHVYAGEADVILDHEAMRWGRSLSPGDKVELAANPPIKAVVKSVQAQREKTQVRLVVKSIDLADLAMGQRIHLKMNAPDPEVENALAPPGIDLPKTKEERIDWFLANIYCTCGIGGDGCTGHFYSLASCNPNSCGAPNMTRKYIGGKIDEGWTNREIFDAMYKQRGPMMLRPHLLP